MVSHHHKVDVAAENLHGYIHQLEGLAHQKQDGGVCKQVLHHPPHPTHGGVSAEAESDLEGHCHPSQPNDQNLWSDRGQRGDFQASPQEGHRKGQASADCDEGIKTEGL